MHRLAHLALRRPAVSGHDRILQLIHDLRMASTFRANRAREAWILLRPAGSKIRCSRR
jgi:hypothetical protein